MTPRPQYQTNEAPYGPDRIKTHDFLRMKRAWRTQFDDNPNSFPGETIGPAVDVDLQFDPCECGCHTRLLLKSGKGHQRRYGRKVPVAYKETQCAGCGKLHHDVG